jgi:hypothetical protein
VLTPDRLTPWRPGREAAEVIGGERGARTVLLLLLAALLAACAQPAPPPATGLAGLPGPPAGPRLLGAALLAPGADVAALLSQLKPDASDYAEVFRLDSAKDARTHYEGWWTHPQLLGPASGQVEVAVESVTTEELLAGGPAADRFAGGFRTIAPALSPGVRIHQIVFHAPGSTLGTRIDGLVYVQGRWRIFPAPWEVLTINEPGHRH